MNWRQRFILIIASLSGLSLLPLPKVPHYMVALEQPSVKSQPQLQHIASSITVKILAGDFLGSGILIKNQGQVYTVVTNAHVLRAGKPPYQIQTNNGRLYSATPVKKLNVVSPHSTSLQKADLALLQFQSVDQSYPLAALGSTSKLKKGNEVYAAGFPGDTQANTDKGFVIKSGRVSLVLNKALEGGYQIAYTNDIQKGMSGGPVLNHAGEVIAINGMHAEPLWGNPYVYQDGTEPALLEQKQMQQYSWGIPLENYLKLLFP